MPPPRPVRATFRPAGRVTAVARRRRSRSASRRSARYGADAQVDAVDADRELPLPDDAAIAVSSRSHRAAIVARARELVRLASQHGYQKRDELPRIVARVD